MPAVPGESVSCLQGECLDAVEEQAATGLGEPRGHPGRAQLEEIARGVATQDGEFPSGDELSRVIEAAAGLTASEAENAYSLALVRHGKLEPETLWELKSQQLKKSGLVSLHRGTESFDQLGGLDNLKRFCLRAMRRQSEGTVSN